MYLPYFLISVGTTFNVSFIVPVLKLYELETDILMGNINQNKIRKVNIYQT